MCIKIIFQSLEYTSQSWLQILVYWLPPIFFNFLQSWFYGFPQILNLAVVKAILVQVLVHVHVYLLVYVFVFVLLYVVVFFLVFFHVCVLAHVFVQVSVSFFEVYSWNGFLPSLTSNTFLLTFLTFFIFAMS